MSKATVGVVCGLASALLYSATNVCLRQVVHVDAVLVSVFKALPTLLLVCPMVLHLKRRGHRLFTSGQDIAWLIATAFIVQIFGNVAFQWSLGVLGLAISVPLVLCTMLVGAAFIGRLVLEEPVGRQKTLAIAILILASIALSYGAERTGGVAGPVETHGSEVLLALAGNIAAGLAYAWLGTMMRRSMQRGMPLASTLFVLSSVGTCLLTAWSLAQAGLPAMLSTPVADLSTMLAAGILNALAFFAMAKSLQHVTVLYVQMLNASQAALAAILGWLLFHEIISHSIGLGLLLTAIGLVVAGLRGRRAPVAPKSPSIPIPEAVHSIQVVDVNAPRADSLTCPSPR